MENLGMLSTLEVSKVCSDTFAVRSTYLSRAAPRRSAILSSTVARPAIHTASTRRTVGPTNGLTVLVQIDERRRGLRGSGRRGRKLIACRRAHRRSEYRKSGRSSKHQVWRPQ